MVDKLLKSLVSPWCVLLVMPFILYIALLACMPLMEPDEGRYSLIPYEMNVAGDYVTPHLKGVDYFEKPVLSYWATALAFKVFGNNAWASRLWVGLCAWGCILLAYWMGTWFHDTKSGVYAAAFLSTSLFPFAIGRINVLDMPLAFFVGLATWTGFRFLAGPERRKRWLYLLYFGSTLAFLTKGLIGIVFPFGILVVWLACERRWRDILRLVSPVGVLIMLAVAGPWLFLVQRANPDFFWFFFVQEHFLRYTTTMHNRYQPMYYFLPILIVGVMPWLGFLPEALTGLKTRFATLFGRREGLFLGIWAGLIVLFFSVSSSKLIPYIAPVFPPLAVILGHICRAYDDTRSGSKGILTTLCVVVQSLIFMCLLFAPLFVARLQLSFAQWWPWIVLPLIAQVLLVFLPHFIRRHTGQGWFASIYVLSAMFLAGLLCPVGSLITPERSAYPIAQAMGRYLPQGEVLYQYKMCAYGIDFYTGARTPVIDDFGELHYGIAKLSAGERARSFLSSAQFIELYKSGRELYCVTDDPDKVAMLSRLAPGTRVIWTNGSFFMLQLKAGAK